MKNKKNGDNLKCDIIYERKKVVCNEKQKNKKMYLSTARTVTLCDSYLFIFLEKKENILHK